uniref:Transthyretin-like family protein n=1 Tax=Parastrongyloides trichosuri TaxID=131310 RepID=A0A0N4ZLX7_PARTI
MIFRLPVVLLFFGVIIHENFAYPEPQAVGVRGRLTCRGKPYYDARITLYDIDSYLYTDSMNKTSPEMDGNFEISGYTYEKTKIEPMMNIHHSCGINEDMDGLCYYDFSIAIPNEYIVQGFKVTKFYNAQRLELHRYYPGEKRFCL